MEISDKIKKEARDILDSFSKELEKIGKKIPEEKVIKGFYEREEDAEEKVEIDREIMFQNAPNKNNDFIIAEKKKW